MVYLDERENEGRMSVIIVVWIMTKGNYLLSQVIIIHRDEWEKLVLLLQDVCFSHFFVNYN